MEAILTSMNIHRNNYYPISFYAHVTSFDNLKKSSRTEKYNGVSFGRFCNMRSVKYWRRQLGGANVKNMKINELTDEQ